jgi:hypothetical protein
MSDGEAMCSQLTSGQVEFDQTTDVPVRLKEAYSTQIEHWSSYKIGISIDLL